MTASKRLIQEIYRDDPWKMLIGCIMLNQTDNCQVHPIIGKFFEKFPNPESVVIAGPNDIIPEIRSLGLYNRRTKNIQNFSHDWLYKKWEKITDCRGIGKYASDSYEIFIKGNLNVDPTDKVLKSYLSGVK